MAGLAPYAASLERRNNLTLFAAGMAIHQHLAILPICNGEARLTIIMRWTSRNPCGTGLATTKRLGDGFCSHRTTRRACCSFALPAGFTSIAGRPSIQARKSVERTSVRRPRFTARTARTITLRTSTGRLRLRSPEVESAAHAGLPVACIAARQVSMPSPTISALRTSPSRTAPPRHGPSIIFSGSTRPTNCTEPMRSGQKGRCAYGEQRRPPNAAEKSSMDGERGVVGTACHQRDQRRPVLTERMLDPAVETQRGWNP